MSGYGFDMGSSGYDEEDRLVNWERDDTNLDQSWDLALVGDWNSITENTSTQCRTHGAAYEILMAASQSITHDVKGNMTSIPAVLRPGSDPLALSWDFDNRLTGADVDNDSTDDVTYEYDALGRRVQRDDGTTATVFVQNGQQTFADYTSGTAATSPTYNYVYASYVDEPVYRDGTGGERYFHRTQQFSIIALTDSTATIKERYAYTVYGTPTIFDASGTIRSTTAEGNRYLYTGREWDDVADFYHYRARIYLSQLGRFGSRDPIGFNGSKWNLFEYTGNNPLRRVDPSGKDFGFPIVPTIPNPAMPPEERIDKGIDMIVITTCFVALVADVATVPSGEGVAGASAFVRVVKPPRHNRNAQFVGVLRESSLSLASEFRPTLATKIHQTTRMIGINVILIMRGANGALTPTTTTKDRFGTTGVETLLIAWTAMPSAKKPSDGPMKSVCRTENQKAQDGAMMYGLPDIH